MSSEKRQEVLIFTSTPNEYHSVKAQVGGVTFEKLTCSVVRCGAGRINASFVASKELAARSNSSPILVGAGTAGSLSPSLKSGDLILSNTSIISDWRKEDGDLVTVSPYGTYDYQPAEPDQIMKMTMICGDPLVLTLMKKAPGSFRPGALLTSEAFVSGKDRKLNLGSTFNCLACDMESGVYAFIGNTLASKPWFNIRVVADTMDDSLGEYFAMEKNMTEILGNGVVEILKILDTLIKYSFMLDAKSLGL